MIYKQKRNRVFRSYFGGKRLDEFFGIENPKDTQFPEEWIASTAVAFNAGRENIVEGPSVLEDGTLLTDLINSNPEKTLGKNQVEKYGNNMSILVKLLDAAERLFIQCHPTAEFSKKYFNSQFGKTECWYIISAEPDACVYIGFKPEITKEKWIECFNNDDTAGLLNLMHRISVKPGDLIFVAGGVPHAIGGGCLLCELQEPTDYMVIPERKSKSGITLTDKKMHGGLGFDRMFDCFVYEGFTEEEIRNKFVKHLEFKADTIQNLVGTDLTDKFSMDLLCVEAEIEMPNDGKYSVAIILEGKAELTFGDEKIIVSKGDELFIDASTPDIHWQGCAKAFICKP